MAFWLTAIALLGLLTPFIGDPAVILVSTVELGAVLAVFMLICATEILD